MILVDSSVWIDYFNGIINPPSDKLDDLLGREPLTIGDLILTEVLQGFANELSFAKAHDLLTSLDIVQLGGTEIAMQAAQNFRMLRRAGITVRKTIDAFIATWCIEHGYGLIHNDKDFNPFEEHLGLQVVR